MSLPMPVVNVRSSTEMNSKKYDTQAFYDQENSR